MNNVTNLAVAFARRSFVVIAAAALISGFFVSNAYAAVTTLTVTSPNGTEEWRGTQNINWSTTGGAPGDLVNIVYSTDNFSSQAVIVTGVAYNAQPYSWDTTSFPESTNFKIRFVDGSGFVYDTSDAAFTVDNSDPVTTATPVPAIPDGLAGWYVSVPTITLSCDDGVIGSGCLAGGTQYRWDGGPWTVYAGAFSPAEGTHTLEWYSEDNAVDALGAHNVEAVQSQVFKVDTTDPTVDVTSTTADGAYNEPDAINVTLTFSEAVTTTDTITVTLETGATDRTCIVPIMTNASVGICTYTVQAGDTSGDLSVNSIVATTGSILDVAGNTADVSLASSNNLNDNSGIVIDTTAPTAFTTGAVTVTGGTVVATWWNSTNTGADVVIPIANDASLTGGTVQIQAEADVTFENVGFAYTVLIGDLGTNKTISLTAAEIEAIAGFSEGDIVTFRAVITDLAGNPTTGADSADTETVDQIAPAVDAGTDKEVNAMASQDATTSDGGSGLATHQWAKVTGTGTITFGTPTTVDTTISASAEDTFGISLTVTDVAGNSALDSIVFVWDVTAPQLTQMTPVPTPTNDNTPSWTFGVDFVSSIFPGGGISYSGSCGSGDLATAVAGSNTTTFSTLVDGTYSNCAVTVTDAAGNTSSALTATSFEVDTVMANVSTITTTDSDFDGEVDSAVIVFDDEVKDSTFVAGDFTIGGVAATTFTTGSANDNTVVLSHAGVAGTNAKTVSYTPGTATDLAGNSLGAISQTSTDAAKPVLLSARTVTTTSVEAMFSEDLNGGTVNGSGNEFTVAGVLATAAAEHGSDDGRVVLTVAAMGTGDEPTVKYEQVDTLADSAGNTAVTPTTVTAVDGVAPVLSVVTIKSDNDVDTAAPEWAKVGDTATLTFTSSETITTPTVSIDGNAAAVSNSGNDWTATYTFSGGEDEGTIPFSIAFADDASPTPNTGTTVTATDDASSVFFDETNPTVNAGTDKEVNALITQDADTSDSTPASGVNTYTWANQTPGVGIITFSNPSGTGTGVDTDISADTDGTYTIRLTVTDNAGNSAFDEITFIWDTTRPEGLTSVPSDDTTGVALAAGTTTVLFDENIVLLDTSRVLFVNDSNESSYKGTASVSGGNGNSATLNIDYTGLAYGTKYRIQVKPGAISDVATNGLLSNFTARFTTAIDTVVPVVNSASAGTITTTGAVLSVTTDESAACSYATTDSAYGSMTAFDGPNTGTAHTATLTGLTPSTGYDYFIRCADTSAQTNTMTTSAHVSFTTATPDTTAPVITNIQAGSITQTGATITWTTDENATSRVEYGLTSSYGTLSAADGSADNPSHSVALAGLTAGTTYHFRVLSTDGASNAGTSVDGTFTTSAPDPDTAPPPAPSITTGTATVNSDAYQISGTAGADTPAPTVRTISVYNGATLAGTAVVPIGQTGWSVSVTLTQDSPNSFSAISADSSGNVSAASSAVVITEDGTVGADVTAPDVPAITTSSVTVDSDTYEIAGTVANDGGVRTISLFESGFVVGTVVLPAGQITWSVTVTLLQDVANVFTAKATDEAGNTSAASASLTITEATVVDTTPPVITLLGVNPQTLTVGDAYTELDATASDDVDGDISGDIDIDASGVNMAAAGTYTVTYDVSDAAGNVATQETRTVIVEAAFDDTASLAVTGIDAVDTFAADTDDFADGWSWTFYITVPTDETEFAMKFADFTSGANTILAASNIRYYSAQSTEADTTGEAVTIAGANTYPGNITLDSDLDASAAGRQIAVTVEMKVPAGSAGGSYSAQYGVSSDTATP